MFKWVALFFSVYFFLKSGYMLLLDQWWFDGFLNWPWWLYGILAVFWFVIWMEERDESVL